MILSFSRNKNLPIKVRVEKLAQDRIVIEEIESNLMSNVIDLDDKDKNDRIPLREIIFRVRASNIALLSNPTPISFIVPRLEG